MKKIRSLHTNHESGHYQARCGRVLQGEGRRAQKATLSMSSGGDWCELLLQSALFRKNSPDQPFLLKSEERTRKKEVGPSSGIISVHGTPGPVA